MSRPHRIGQRLVAALAAGCAGLALAGTAGAVDLRSWDMKINDVTKRFIVLPAFGNQAVLDKETQIVWQRTPGHDNVSFEAAWKSCYQAATGGRVGWRLPTLSEFRSLIDPAVTNSYAVGLPAGHPFIGVLPPFGNPGGYYGKYWTSTLKTNQDTAYRFAAVLSRVTYPTPQHIDTQLPYTWCVRGIEH